MSVRLLKIEDVAERLNMHEKKVLRAWPDFPPEGVTEARVDEFIAEHARPAVHDEGSLWVYVVRQVGGGPVKIGITGNFERRLRSLAAGCPAPLETLALLRAERSDEKSLHVRFHEERLHNEWFHPSARLLRFVEELPAGINLVRKISVVRT